MKGTNPIIPPGMNFEGTNRGRSNMRMAVIVVVLLHVVLFTGILFNACKQKEDDASGGAQNTTAEDMAQIVAQQPVPPTETSDLQQPLATTTSALPAISALPPLPPLPNAGGTTLSATPDSAVLSSQSGLPAPPLTPAPIASTSSEHIVVSGESFWTIGKKYGVSSKSIEAANPNVIPTRLKIGQKIMIPPKLVATSVPVRVDDGTDYTVKSGDTLGHIALKYRTKIANLKSINGLTSDFLKIGQKLTVPARATAPLAPVPTAAPALSPTTGLPISVPAPPTAVGPSTILKVRCS